MSSYYKKIDGKNYDRSMLEIAEGSITGRGDGRISLADSRKIIKVIKDGGKVTDIERRTLNYILENYTLTETALKHVEKSLADDIQFDVKKTVDVEKEEIEHVDASQILKPPVNDKNTKKIFIILVLILFILSAAFIFIKYFYKNAKTENTITEKKEEISEPMKEVNPAEMKEEAAGPEKETAEKTSVVNNTELPQEKPLSENEYLVKDKDSLIKISEELYGDYRKWEEIYKLNKEKISSPSVLYPGQVLKMPEKNVNK